MQAALGFNSVIFLDPPQKALPSQRLDVFYSCNQPATVQLDLIVLFDTGHSRVVQLNHWDCDPYGKSLMILELNLPDWLVYQADGIVPSTPWVLTCMLELALTYPGSDDMEELVAAEDVAYLEPVPLFERPLKQHQLCIAWNMEMLRLTQQFLNKHCLLEQGKVHLLSSIFASVGKNVGISKTMAPFRNKALDYLRVKTINSTRFMLSMWVLLTRHCEHMCGLFYHIDSRNEYNTPALFIINSGQLHIQMNGELKQSFAFLTPFRVPLNEWCQIGITVLLRKVTVSMVCIDKEQRTAYSAEYISGYNVVMDDTDGYFVIGGGKFIGGGEGYYGPLVFHRNRILPQHRSKVVLPDVVRAVNLTGWMHSCKMFHLEMSMKIREYSKQRLESDTCFDVFHELMVKDRTTSKPQCELWEETAPHRRIAVRLAKILAFRHGDRGVSLAALGRALYSLSLQRLGRGGRTGAVSRILPLLLQAGCLADNRALNMASVLYSSGLGVTKQPYKSWLLALLAAQEDDLLALMHLGQRHLDQKGNHGFPVDLDLAYAYYANIAKETNFGHDDFTQKQMVLNLNEVILLNPPEKALPHHILHVIYFCNGVATAQLDLVVTFDTGITEIIQLTDWRCNPRDPQIKAIQLNLPDWLVYQADGIVPDSQWVQSCTLEIALTYPGFDDTEEMVAAEDGAALEPVPFFERPMKQHQLCINWDMQMLQLTQHFSKKQCLLEQETVHMLSSVFASTGEHFGITKTLDPFNDSLLESLRMNAIFSPSCMISMWIFVNRHCQEKLCGLLHHIDSNKNYISPSVFLRNSGQLHIQMNGESTDSSAFLTSFKVPLSEWCQIRMEMFIRRVIVSMVCVDGEQRTEYASQYFFGHNVVLDDTVGYFVIGGSRYVNGIEGYYGPLVFHRNRVLPQHKSEVFLPDVIRAVNLTGWMHSCQLFQLEMSMKIREYSHQAEERAESSKNSFDAFHEWLEKTRQPSEPQCEPWEETVPNRREAAKLAKILAFKHGDRGDSLAALGRALYSLSLQRLNRGGRTGAVSRILPLLLQAGCLADNRALHMASVLYSSGLGVKKQPYKSWLLALLAAQKDDRLALMHLGHLHHQGFHGFPVDQALAYAYYANIAKQTNLDRHSPIPGQTFVEAVYLNNEEVLNLQTNKDHHIFQWLKHQAQRGAAEAEQAIARMLFWGQQGVSPNIQEAVRHYERGAVQLEDPVSMYDYGIVLLEGQGIKKDVPRAITFLKKSMDKGFVPAISALAWYYEQHEHDDEKAVKLWEQADHHGSPDAALNLGVLYSQGRYPGKAADEFVAYLYYVKAAERGNIRGGILLAEILTTGIPGRINRHQPHAVLWVKWAAEHNGYLGTILRKALDSYLKRDMFTSLLYYLMAAECGYAPAQFNVAYLCEHNTLGILDPVFASSCMWRYYNLTIQSQNPDPYALIKMGDLLYEGGADVHKDLFSAAEMYALAAMKQEPQGWYNLGVLVAEGYRLPLSVLIKLGLSELYLEDNILLQSALYERCRDSGNSDGYLPCSLALYNVYIQSFQKDYNTAIKVSTAVAVLTASTILLIIRVVLRRASLSLN
ncbi:protein sel-1 homolog 3 [Cheilinus undulatus]|uniref:protein sel-1 homolog 3 n=1 Tax=Cheilinus undulatus TaxID=241271 RepID=UPI001BD215AF|nr:protein sel-1 homolog 3 [Cheilinus undulatus]